MLRFVVGLAVLGGCDSYNLGGFFDEPDARPVIPNVPVAAVECSQPCVPVTPADTVVAFETVWYAIPPGASAATPKRYTIAAYCTGLECDATPPSGSVSGEGVIRVVPRGDGMFVVDAALTDLYDGKTVYVSSQPLEVRTITGLAFACTLDGAPCPDPIPASGGDVIVTAYATSTEGPFDLFYPTMTIDHQYPCDLGSCESRAVVPETLVIDAGYGSLTAELTLTIQ